MEFLDSSLSGTPFQLFKTGELQFCSYQTGVPEHETMEFTGNRSIESVRRYKRQNEEILHNIFKALQNESIENLTMEIANYVKHLK